MNGMALLNTHSFIPGIFSINLFDPRCELVIVCGCKIYKPIVIDMRFGKTIHWNQFSEKKTLLTDFSTNFPPSVEAFFCCSTYSVLCLPIIDRPAIYVFYPCQAWSVCGIEERIECKRKLSWWKHHSMCFLERLHSLKQIQKKVRLIKMLSDYKIWSEILIRNSDVWPVSFWEVVSDIITAQCSGNLFARYLHCLP